MIEPRYRLYTTPNSYLGLSKTLFFGNSENQKQLLAKTISEIFDSPNSIPVPQCRVGIYFAVKALVSPGKKILMSPYTLADVVNMVICAGAIPEFVDIDRKSCNISADAISKHIDFDVSAVLVTHLHGLACDMDAIVKICNQHKLPLIEDVAQSFGSHFKGKALGTFGDAGIYSFGMYKAVNAFYGGMLVTPHEHLANNIQIELAKLPDFNHAMLFKKMLSGLASDIATWPPLFSIFTFWVFRYAYLHDIEWLNRKVKVDIDPKIKTKIPDDYLCQMTSAQAKIVQRQLLTYEAFIEKRIELAKIYDEGLKDIKEIIIPPLNTDGSHVYAHYAIQAPDRENLIRYLIKNGQDVAIQHLKNCASLTCFSEHHRDCPNAEATASENILMASYARYSKNAVEKNIRLIRDFYGYD